MRLIPDIAWRTTGHPPAQLDARLLPLLREIRKHATLRAAIVPLGMSYRGAWDLLGAQARVLGAPLVRMVRGRGALLAPLAEKLVAADDAAREEIETSRERLSVLVEASSTGERARLRVAASHDLLLAEFGTPSLDLVFRGSLESVRAFARGEVDLAGFHLSADPGESALYKSLLLPRRDRLIRFARREQGLLLPAGNPKGVRRFEDIAKQGLKFVNRQRGSGTRQLIDQLVRQSGLDGADIKGYNDEEFTHLAVAATIASGRADAGVGVRAAAVRFGIAFVPLGEEHYWLVARQRDLEQGRMKQLVAALQDGKLKRLARRLTGYDVTGAGEILPLRALQKTEDRP